MTELTQSLTSAPTETVAVATHDAATPPSFPELIYAHYDWWRELRGDGVTDATQARYDELRNAFQREHGQIVRAYWCTHVESAVALTQQKTRFGGTRCGFYRETHWATRDQPDIANEMYRCDELAVRATTVLSGVRQRICMNLMMASAEHLMSLVDRRAAHADPKASDEILEREHAAIERTEAYYKGAANGQAQMVYFAGMALVVVVLSAVAAIWLSIEWAAPVAALVAGRDRRARQRRPADQLRKVRSRLRRGQAVRAVPRRAAPADRRCVRDGDHLRVHRRPAAPAGGGERDEAGPTARAARDQLPRRVQRALGAGHAGRSRPVDREAGSRPAACADTGAGAGSGAGVGACPRRLTLTRPVRSPRSRSRATSSSGTRPASRSTPCHPSSCPTSCGTRSRAGP